MKLIKTSILSGISVFFKVLTLLGINKILAIYVGPSGYATIGQLQNVLQICTGVLTGTLSNGITKLTAEYQGDIENQKEIWKTSSTFSILGCILLSLLIYTYSYEISLGFLGDGTYADSFSLFSITLVFLVLNVLMQSMLNGRREVKKYVLTNIAGSFVSLIFVTIFTVKYGLYGAMVSLVVYQSVCFFSTLIICLNCQWFKISYLWGRVNFRILKKLSVFFLMALSSAILAPAVQLLIRDYISNEVSIISAGYWEAVWRLSSAYLMVITTTLSVYYLPVLSALNNKYEIKKEVISGSKIIIPIAIILSFSVYILKDFIIIVLFSEDFLPAAELVAWQMVGDTIKIASWIISFLMLAKAMLTLFLISQVLSHSLFYYSSVYFIDNYGLIGVSYAHVVNFVIYFLFVYFFVYRKVVYKSEV